MANIEKLIKAFEALKVFSPTASAEELSLKRKDAPLSKKEKITHCQIIADAIIASSIRIVPDFHKFLGIVVETFLLCCDDEDSDVRMIADECLTKIIKALTESNLGRIQVELYKEIKKNGSSRSLRASLWRFADLCIHIRPQKCRIYIVNLLPCLNAIAQRTEEMLQETLSIAVEKIFPILGKFSNDAETKSLLKTFVPNLKSSSATTRRTAAYCLSVICEYSRKPHMFVPWLLTTLLEFLIPIQITTQVHDLLGILLSIRYLLPLLKNTIRNFEASSANYSKKDYESIDLNSLTEQYLQVYEVLLYYTQHEDHNVVTACLETLQQLLLNPSEQLLDHLVNRDSITKTQIYCDNISESIRPRTLSQLSVFRSSVHGDDVEALADDQEVLIASKTSSVDYYNYGYDQSSIQSCVSEDHAYNDSDSNDDMSEYSSIPIGKFKQAGTCIVSSNPTSPYPVISPDQREKISDERSNFVEVECQEISLIDTSPDHPSNRQIGDIGSFIDRDVPLHYCARLLCSSFLLSGTPGSLMPDKNVRVSVKSLALQCLADVFSYCPESFYIPLFKSSPSESVQWIQDVILFSKHGDPRIRGSSATLLGTFLKSSLTASGCQFETWLKEFKHLNEREESLDKHVSTILELIEDDSSVSCRMGLQAMNSCFSLLLQSVNANLALKIIKSLMKIRSNPYWLVKVELLEVLSTVDFKTIAFLENHASTSKLQQSSQNLIGKSIQWKVINDVAVFLLGDEDHRVRTSAGQSLIKIIPNMFYPSDQNMHNPLVASAKEKTTALLDYILNDDVCFPPIHGAVQPYDSLWKSSKRKNHISIASIEGNLTRVLNIVIQKLVLSTSRHLTFGCIQALNYLSQEYVVTLYINAWSVIFSEDTRKSSLGLKRQQSFSGCSIPDPSSETCDAEAGLLSYLLSLLTTSSLTMDLMAHQNMLQLIGNLSAGACYHYLTQNSTNGSNSEAFKGKPWALLQDKHLANNMDIITGHLMKLLAIYLHIIDEVNPGPPHVKPTLPSLPTTTSLSPVKRRIKSKEDGNLPSPLTGVAKSSPSKQSSFDSKIPLEKDKNSIKFGLGTFYNSPHYMKLYEGLRGAYSGYKICLDLQGSEKLVGLLKSCLTTMCQILEIAGVEEMGKCAEELLGYLKSILNLDSPNSILCVQQLLKALFGTNLASWFEGNASQINFVEQISSGIRKPGHATRLSSNSTASGLYHNCFTTPYSQLSQALSLGKISIPSVESTEENQSNGWVSWLRRKSEKKPSSSTVKSTAKIGDKNSLASYIRLFEPLVIKALKQYTTTSSVELQTQVLDLLAQLVYLRVNYCLLDSEQIFLGFVVKQFEYIEEGQITSPKQLISHIFHFLVLLSYERYHSKSVIDVPQIIQLCDGLMASGQPSIDYVIPALIPVVNDLFQMRMINKSDPAKELETQREVVISMLFRLLQYPQVLEMLITVLKQSRKESEDRWKKLSRQIIDLLLPMLTKQQVIIDSMSSLTILNRLFEEVSPSVFRPVDDLLKAIFASPQNLDCCVKKQRWICFSFAILRTFVSQSKEEVVLSRLSALNIAFSGGVDTIPSQFELQSLIQPAEETSPPDSMARFLFHIVGLVALEIKNGVYKSERKCCNQTFLCQLAAHLMLVITYMFQSGMFRRVANAAMSMIRPKNSEIEEYSIEIQQINRIFLDFAIVYPTLTLQWCNILILLNYDDHLFWTEVLRATKRRSASSPKHVLQWKSTSTDSSNVEMVRKGGLILFCDYVCENPNDAEQMTWLIANHVNELITLSSEPPIHDFICAIHRNSAASGLLIQAVNARCDDLSNPSFVRRTLLNLEAVHASQTGSLLTLLIDKFLGTHHLTVVRTCDSMACHRLEMLLNESAGEAAAQLPLEDVDKLLNIIKSANIIHRHARLITLLMKLRTKIAPGVPAVGILDSEQPMLTNVRRNPGIESPCSPPESSVLTKDWYISIVKKECCKLTAVAKVCAKLLSFLEHRDIIGIMMLKHFNLKILQDSLQLGLHETLNVSHKEKSSPSSESSISTPVVPNYAPYSSNHEYPLYAAARITLLQHVSHIVSLLPHPHQVFHGCRDSLTSKETKYQAKLHELFNDQGFMDTLFQIIPVLTCYLNTLKYLPWVADVPTDSLTDISTFCVLCIEVMQWIIEKEASVCYQSISLSLSAVSTILKNPTLTAVIALEKHMSWTNCLVAGSYDITKYLLKKDNFADVKVHFPEAKSQEELLAQRSCRQIVSLISWLEQVNGQTNQIPEFIYQVLKELISGLGRLPMVNSYARIPPFVWEMNWQPEFGGTFNTSVPPPSGEFLQERDVLKQYIFRVNTLGWTSRQQFEETWMALLGVLSATPVLSSISEEDEERIQTSCLAVKCITALLLQTMLLPQPGNPHSSTYLQQHRNKPLGFIHTKRGKKLMAVRGTLTKKLEEWKSCWRSMDFGQCQKSHQIFDMNMERISSPNRFSIGQVSLEYIWTATGMMDEEGSEAVHDGGSSSASSSPTTLAVGSQEYHQREQSLAAYGLDIHSCLHFLLDLYSQWMSPPHGNDIIINKTPLSLLMEVTRSVVLLSDIFTERAQFDWMQNIMLELTRVHPPEDEVISQYLILGICKSAAVLNMESEMVERLKKLVELSLKSTYLPVRIATLHGILYFLQLGLSDEIQGFIPIAIDYIIKHLDNSNLPSSQSEEHVLVMWSVIFYIFENFKDVIDPEVVQRIFQLAVQIVSAHNDIVPYPVYLSIIQGLERLLLTDFFSHKEIEILLKLSKEKLRQQNPNKALPASGLLVSCMYSVHSEKQVVPVIPDTSSEADLTPDHETIITAMERATVLFDRIKKGFPYEAEIISTILPTFLIDFFPSQEILNKVIGEFLSSQQPHPQLMASVVFKVFESLHLQSQQILIQDWVMLSLSNFTQRSPVSMAIWSLTCFFVSASTNTWLRSLFPVVQQRMGKLETFDCELFVRAALDFRDQLMEESQRKAFKSTIQVVAEPNTPYMNLLAWM